MTEKDAMAAYDYVVAFLLQRPQETDDKSKDTDKKKDKTVFAGKPGHLHYTGRQVFKRWFDAQWKRLNVEKVIERMLFQRAQHVIQRLEALPKSKWEPGKFVRAIVISFLPAHWLTGLAGRS